MVHIVFTNLHDINNGSIAKTMTEEIKKYIPGALVEDDRKKFTKNSRWQGYITQLSFHKDITIFQACNCSGN